MRKRRAILYTRKTICDGLNRIKYEVRTISRIETNDSHFYTPQIDLKLTCEPFDQLHLEGQRNPSIAVWCSSVTEGCSRYSPEDFQIKYHVNLSFFHSIQNPRTILPYCDFS